MFINLDRIFSSGTDGIVALDSDLRYVFINDAAEAMLGLSRQAALGRTPMEVLPAGSLAELIDRIRAAIVASLRQSRDVLSLAMRGGRMGAWSVRLPLASTPVATPAVSEHPGRAADVVPASGARVLIVDDNVDAAEMLAHALGLNGHHTWVAHDGPEALRQAAMVRPSAAFLDIGLPVMDGYELAARLREIPGLEAIRLVAVTGYGQESDRQRSAAAGFHHHLVKPVNLDEVVAVLDGLASDASS